MKGIKKYYIGLGIVGLFTMCMLGFVLTQGASYKTDKKTNEVAAKIAEDINSYILLEQKIPDQLKDATSNDIPEQVTYMKSGSKGYTFCVSYKNNSGPSLDASSIVYQGLSGRYTTPDYSSFGSSSYKPSSLYISTYSWQKGKNCQDIEPYLRNRNSSTTNDLYDPSSNTLCEPPNGYYYLYYPSLCEPVEDDFQLQ